MEVGSSALHSPNLRRQSPSSNPEHPPAVRTDQDQALWRGQSLHNQAVIRQRQGYLETMRGFNAAITKINSSCMCP